MMELVEEYQPNVLFIAGPNGAGKSTLAPALLRDEIGLLEFVNADTIALGLSAFAPETAALEAGRVMLGRIRSLAARRESFALETTLATRSYAPWVARMRERSGYRFHLLYLWLRHADLAVARVAERVRAGGHDVPEAIVRRRYVLGARNFFELYRPLADSWAVYDNSVAGEPQPIAVGERDSALRVSDEELWTKLCLLTRRTPA
jgi:predicted ABC-type ATPase